MWSRNHQDKFRSSRLEGLSGPGTTRTSSDLAGPLLVGSSCWFIFFDGITAKAGQHKSDTKKAPTEVQPGTSNANKRVPAPVAFSGFCLAMTWLLIIISTIMITIIIIIIISLGFTILSLGFTIISKLSSCCLLLLSLMASQLKQASTKVTQKRAQQKFSLAPAMQTRGFPLLWLFLVFAWP